MSQLQGSAPKGSYDSFFGTNITPIGKWWVKTTNRLRLRLLMSSTPIGPDTVFLEIGPGGAGLGILAAQTTGCRLVAIEGSRTAVSLLREQGVEVIEVLVPPIPWEESTVDLVVAINVIEHMPSVREAREFVTEALRVLRPSGLIVLGTGNILDLGRFFFSDYTHTYPLSPQGIHWLLRDHGFDIVLTRLHVGPFFSPWLRRPVNWLGKLIPWRLISTVLTGLPDSPPWYKALLSTRECIFVVGRKPEE